MAPFLPLEIISEGWSLILMFLIGISFGFILEAAGFSSSRKLVGIFYGYDFVVLKVFFTAGITAMIGLVFMEYFGFIDMSLVFINSNFLWSALIGGVIMGFGFILGGFCPGTSVTAAVIGKIDAWFFIIGIFLGIFIFGSFDTTFNKLFTGYYFDGERLFDTIGISRGLFIFMMILMAIGGFIVGHYFENKAKEELKPSNIKFSSYRFEIFVLIVLGLIIMRLPEKSPNTFSQKNEKAILENLADDNRYINYDEFAYNIMRQIKGFYIIDIRSEEEFRMMNFPGSINIPLEFLSSRQYKNILKLEGQKVLISNGGSLAELAWVYTQRMNYEDFYVLKGGINNFIKEIFFEQIAEEGEFRKDVLDSYRFKQNAAEFFKEGKVQIKISDKEMPEIKEPKPIQTKSAGGC